MVDEPLERCVCDELPGFLFADGARGERHVAIGCPACGTKTENFPLDQAEDAVLAWEAGEFAEGSPTVFGETWVSQPVRAAQGRRPAMAPVGS